MDADAGEPPIVTSTFASGLAMGGDKACILDTAGKLVCWGGFHAPEPIAPTETWKQVTTGGLSDPAAGVAGCALRSDDTLWCWPHGGAPVQPAVGTFQYVRTSLTNRCAIGSDGSLSCWGTNNVFGQLGVGDTVARSTPTLVGSETDWKLVAPGRDHTCAIKTGGALYCWGWNAFGQVGDDTILQRTAPVPIDAANTYVDVDTRWLQSCAIRTNGNLACWGTGVGIPQRKPTLVDGATDWAKVRVGIAFACALKTNGSLWCWGSNDRGQLGLPPITENVSRLNPTRVGSATDWEDIAAGDASACARKKTGTIWCWGSNAGGQLGAGNGWRLTPARVGAPGEFASVSVGPDNVCAVRKSGSLACWGIQGPMPIAGVAAQTPTTITTATDWKTAKPSYTGACATKSNDALWCWKTGSPPATESLTVSSYDVGYSHQVAVAGGSLYGWGDNIFGKAIATSTPLTVTTRVMVGTDTTWRSVAANFDSSCGIKSDGSLWCWGFAISTGVTRVGNLTTWSVVDRTPGTNNGFYGLAGGRLYTWVASLAPTAVGTDTDWIDIAAGLGHVCGVRSNGSLWCQGANENGQLGDGTTTSRTAAVRIGSGTDWAKVSAGNLFTCGLTTGGDLYCWGSNEFGVLGDGYGFRTAPMVVP